MLGQTFRLNLSQKKIYVWLVRQTDNLTLRLTFLSKIT